MIIDSIVDSFINILIISFGSIYPVESKVKSRWNSEIRMTVQLKSVKHASLTKPLLVSETFFMEQKDWFKPRGYLHIDSKISSKKRKELECKISNPKYIERHGFFPLLYKTLSERRYKKIDGDNGTVFRSHSEKGKSTKKIRPIHYASHIDSQIYAYYNHKVISPAYENLLSKTIGLSDCVSAYRRIPAPEGYRNKCNIHFAKDAFDEIRSRKNCIAIALDIKSFFSTLDHQILLERWKEVLNVDYLPKDHYKLYKSVTRFRYINLNELRINGNNFDEREIASFQENGIEAFFSSMESFRDKLKTNEFIVRKNQFYRKEKGRKFSIGIPQGLPISALLANIYMYQFDFKIYQELCLKRNVFYRRYSDDIVLVCDIEQHEFVIKFVKNLIVGNLVKLKLSEDKTEKIIFKEIIIGGNKRLQSFLLKSDGTEIFNIPFNYLGFQFYGYQILIKNSRVSNFYRRMKRAVRRQHIKAEKAKEYEERKIIYKTRLYRLFSYKGTIKRELPSKSKYILTRDRLGYWKRKPIVIHRKHRGNALRYVHKAADIMNAPEIKKQYRNHFKILQKTIKKYNFDNSKKG